MKLKIFIIFIVCLLLGTNIFWIFTTLDSALTQTYANASFDNEKSKNDVLLRLSNRLTSNNCLITKKEINDLYVDTHPFEEKPLENNLIVKTTRFVFDQNNCLKSIEYN